MLIGKHITKVACLWKTSFVKRDDDCGGCAAQLTALPLHFTLLRVSIMGIKQRNEGEEKRGFREEPVGEVRGKK